MVKKSSFISYLLFSVCALACLANDSYALTSIDNFLLTGHTIYGRLNTAQHIKAKEIPPFHVRLQDSAGKIVTQQNGKSMRGTYDVFAQSLHDSAFDEQGFTPEFLSILQKAFVKYGKVLISSEKGKIKISLEYPGIRQDQSRDVFSFVVTADTFKNAQDKLVSVYNNYHSAKRTEAALTAKADLARQAALDKQRRKTQKETTLAKVMATYDKIGRIVKMTSKPSLSPELSANNLTKVPSTQTSGSSVITGSSQASVAISAL